MLAARVTRCWFLRGNQCCVFRKQHAKFHQPEPCGIPCGCRDTVEPLCTVFVGRGGAVRRAPNYQSRGDGFNFNSCGAVSNARQVRSLRVAPVHSAVRMGTCIMMVSCVCVIFAH